MNRAVILGLAAAAATAAITIKVTPTGSGVQVDAEYVIPDCATLPDGGEDPTPVDCRFDGPYSRDGGPQWRGCNAGLAVHALGTQCVAAPGVIRAGSVLKKARGAMREFSKADVELAEPTLPDGGKVR